jgi:hypothetical protein
VHVDDEKAAEYGEFMHKQGQKFFDFGKQTHIWLAGRIRTVIRHRRRARGAAVTQHLCSSGLCSTAGRSLQADHACRTPQHQASTYSKTFHSILVEQMCNMPFSAPASMVLQQQNACASSWLCAVIAPQCHGTV